jgi:hypothetical protein
MRGKERAVMMSKEGKGRERKGKEGKGRERKGKEGKGRERKGKEGGDHFKTHYRTVGHMLQVDRQRLFGRS